MQYMEILLEIKDLYALKNITRFNNLSRINDESVAEHGFFVSLIVARLYRKYNFNLGKALLMATIHDIFEIWTSDVPRNIKDKYEKLDKLLMEIETDVIESKFPEYKKLINEFNNESTPEGRIVKVADQLSVYQYTNEEVSLGNSGYMKSVYDEVLKKIEKNINNLKDLKRR